MVNFWKVLNEVISSSDIIIEVLDSRMVEETRNKELEDKISQPIVFVLNKCDLISQEEGDRLKKEFKGNAVFVSTTKYHGIKKLKDKLNSIIQDKDQVVIGVVGYPNTGKSSLINALTNRGSAKTSAQSGYTRGKQLIKMSNKIYLLDTPGVIPYKENDETKHGLIATANPSEIKDPDIVAMQIIKRFIKKDMSVLENKYNIKIEQNILDDEYEILLLIGKTSNLLKKGGDVDERRTSIKIIQDWQRGKIKNNYIHHNQYIH